jgi:hypothetical protein
MTGVRKHVKIPPAHSPSLPGYPIDANVCRNPACDNFGISEDDIRSAKHGYEYTVTDGVLKHKCKRCKQTHVAYSNISMLEAFHRCLMSSIPYVSCPDPECKNHYVNLFEYYHDDLRDKREKHYRVNVANDAKSYYQARCRSCDATFPLSKPLRLHTSKQRFWRKDLETFITAVVNNSGPSHIMNQMRVGPSRYYAQLKAAANALLNFNNYHLLNLLKPSRAPEQLRIYTDCIVISKKVDRDDQRHFKVKIIVSTCYRNGSLLVVAFHPLFDQRIIKNRTIQDDQEQPLGKRRFESLKHPMSKKEKDPLPHLKLGGHFMEDFYAYLSHFLVLRKLLARVPSLHLYMDGEASLYNAALNAFADRIKSGSCDIVVRKMDKEKKGSQNRDPKVLNKRANRIWTEAKRVYRKAHPDTKTPDHAELRRFSFNEEMQRVNKAIQESRTQKNGELFPEPLSRIYTAATRNPNSKGKDFWVTNKLPNRYNTETKMLWLTRTAERSNTDYELDLYLNGSIFYVDNFFNALRYRSSITARPGSTATGHKNYNRNSELPLTLIRDFTINAAFWNFFLKFRSDRKETIAYAHGLVRKPGSPDIRKAFQNRYTFDNAKRISKWLGT